MRYHQQQQVKPISNCVSAWSIAESDRTYNIVMEVVLLINYHILSAIQFMSASVYRRLRFTHLPVIQTYQKKKIFFNDTK